MDELDVDDSTSLENPISSPQPIPQPVSLKLQFPGRTSNLDGQYTFEGLTLHTLGLLSWVSFAPPKPR